MIGFTDSDATIIVALISFVGGVIGLFVQNRRNTKAQRSDHAATADKVDKLVIAVEEMAESGREIRDDVREIKAEVRDHGQRLRSLEHLSVSQDEVEAIVSKFPRRKAQ